MSRAGTPVTGGNVSLCNEDGETAIRPTPVIGMVGVIDDVELRVPMGSAQKAISWCFWAPLAMR